MAGIGMKYKGINYDVGNNYREGMLSRKDFDPEVIEKEIQIICSELNCNAIRISGYDMSRVITASEIALKNNMTVFFSPLNINASTEEAKNYILRGAVEAEILRGKYNNVVYVLGCELTIFSKGFIKGETTNARLRGLFNPLSILLNQIKVKRKYNRRLNDFIGQIMPEIRRVFKGEITYASGTWEAIDWDQFDIIGIDHYRDRYNKTTYRQVLKSYFSYKKPVAVLEFGCCSYKGAEEKGGAGWMIVDFSKGRPELKGNFIRDESVQSDYVKELLDIFNEGNTAGAFVFTFVQTSYVRNEDPKYDLDMASYGITAPLPGGKTSDDGLPWIRKKAFYMLSEYFQNK